MLCHRDLCRTRRAWVDCAAGWVWVWVRDWRRGAQSQRLQARRRRERPRRPRAATRAAHLAASSAAARPWSGDQPLGLAARPGRRTAATGREEHHRRRADRGAQPAQTLSRRASARARRAVTWILDQVVGDLSSSVLGHGAAWPELQRDDGAPAAAGRVELVTSRRTTSSPAPPWARTTMSNTASGWPGAAGVSDGEVVRAPGRGRPSRRWWWRSHRAPPRPARGRRARRGASMARASLGGYCSFTHQSGSSPPLG